MYKNTSQKAQNNNKTAYNMLYIHNANGNSIQKTTRVLLQINIYSLACRLQLHTDVTQITPADILETQNT